MPRKGLIPIPPEALTKEALTKEALTKEALTKEAEEQAKESQVSNDTTAVTLTDMEQKIKVRKNNIAILEKEIEESREKIRNIEEAKATATGGYKKKYTVKELKSIASRNNIKTTKKLDGKTVNLNKKGLMAKLKRKKLI
jgi:hypothetical protein